jgi:hypothetical protein
MKEGTMPQVKVRVLVNCDDALIFWSVPAVIKDCLGIAIGRERTRGGQTFTEVLDNRMGFGQDDLKPGDRYPSVLWPFQRLWWTDHSVQIGDEVRYRVWPMVFTDEGLVPLESARSEWTEEETLTPAHKTATRPSLSMTTASRRR